MPDMWIPITSPDGIAWIPTQTVGVPRGTAGRSGYSIQGIVLHCLEQSLERYDAILCQAEKLTKAKPEHSSLHYAVGTDGAIHQYVEEGNISWGFAQYMSNFPAPYPVPGLNWPPLSNTYPGVTPDYYVINIGLEIGVNAGPDVCCDGPTVLRLSGYRSLVHLLAWLMAKHCLPVDEQHVTWHQTIDPAAEDECVCADLAELLTDVRNYCEPCQEPASARVPEGEITRLVGTTPPACCDQDIGCMVYEDAASVIRRWLPLDPQGGLVWTARGLAMRLS